MNTSIEKLFLEAEGRYFTNSDIEKFTTYTQSIPQRLGAMKAIERVEGSILEGVIQEVWQRHPEFEKKHQYSREKCIRDVGYVLRYCALSMIRNDPSYLEEKLLFWLRTILHSFDFTQQFIDTTYSELLKQTERHLKTPHFQLVQPYLVLTHRTLTMEESRGE